MIDINKYANKVKTTIEDKYKLKRLAKQLKKLKIYKGKNQTKRRRSINKKQKIQLKVNYILYPYYDKFMNIYYSEMFNSFGSVTGVEEFCKTNRYEVINNIDDFGISKKLREEENNNDH